MIAIVHKTINDLAKKPQKLFLIDSLGALLTTFFLFVVLRNFYEYVGMPIPVLTYLSVIALGLCIYSTACFFFLKGNWTPFIRGISIGNLLYCILTMVLVIIYYSQLKTIGMIYFVIEVIIILGLVYIERNVAIAILKESFDTNKND